jgi:bifunctional DNase/RNase
MAPAARLVLLGLMALPLACGERPAPVDPEVPVRVQMVAVDSHNLPVVILEEEHGGRLLPIWIGTAEATSIAAEIDNRPPPRPNSHDMARRVIQHLEAEVERVLVTELRDGTYYALLTLRTGGRRIDIDVRPSDGIAVALRAEAPILVRASVFEDAGGATVEDRRERSI